MIKPVQTDRNIPKQFQNTRYSDYDVERGDPKVLRQLEGWKPTPERPSVLLMGSAGLGKTMLACAILNERHARFTFTGRPSAEAARSLTQWKDPVYFISLAELITLQIRSFNIHSAAMRDECPFEEYLEIDQLLEDLKYGVKMLVLDDVGKEHRTSTGFAEDTFDLLARTRHNEGLSTIYTSNVPVGEWSNQYSNSMENFIRRSSLVVEFRKPSVSEPSGPPRRGVRMGK